jgi:tetratricopeptide (TPR) repeat protein
MRKPEGMDKLSVAPNEIALGPYPSMGFLPVWNAELGNGDYYGLYWPLGREAREPVICDMLHDEWRLQPAFSSVPKFWEWLEKNDHERGEVEVDDQGFAPACFRRGKELLAQGQVEGAVAELRNACASFPEVGEYWFTLAGQLRRVGQTDESLGAVLNAFRANWVFGRPAEGVLRMLQGAARGSVIANDPLVQRAAKLTMKFGGEKENSNYAILRECVQAYFEAGQPLHALQLHQNHAYMMTSETVSFQERQGFVRSAWQAEFSVLCEKHLGDSRLMVV